MLQYARDSFWYFLRYKSENEFIQLFINAVDFPLCCSKWKSAGSIEKYHR